MVAPITTGILRRNVKFTAEYAFVTYYDRVVGSKQAKPVTVPLPYNRRTGSAARSGPTAWGTTDGAEQSVVDMTAGFAGPLSLARNKAYEKLKDEIYSSSQLGASLAEYNQSLAMVAARGKQLLDGAKALRRLDFQAASRAFSVRLPPGKNFRNSKSFGNLWLEFHFGWEPLIKDIHEGLEVATRPVKTLWAKARASEPATYTILGGDLYRTYELKYTGRAYSVMQTGIQINNPNIVLANQLGLLNPASIAWELTPFSFVVDWYANIGSVLNSMSDYLGCTLVNPYHTDVLKAKFDKNYQNKPVNPGIWARVKGNCTYMDRNSGLILPVLAVRPLKTPSVVRAATQISLLTQFLGRK